MKIWIRSTLPMEDNRDLHGHRQPWIFVESARAFGVAYENQTLGRQHDWTGRANIPLFCERLTRLPADEIVLITDPWDVFFCAGVEEIERKFLAAETPLLFAAETNLFPPDTAALGMFPPAPTRFRYIKGGQLLGRAAALLALFQAPDFWLPPVMCDQQAYNAWWMRHPDRLKVDHRCEIFQTLFNDPASGPGITDVLTPEAVDGKTRWRNTETGSLPAMIHGNGGTAATAAQLWIQIRPDYAPLVPLL
jgi:hypothetical protein